MWKLSSAGSMSADFSEGAAACLGCLMLERSGFELLVVPLGCAAFFLNIVFELPGR